MERALSEGNIEKGWERNESLLATTCLPACPSPCFPDWTKFNLHLLEIIKLSK